MGRRVKNSFVDLIAPDLRSVYIRELARQRQEQLDRMAWDVFRRHTTPKPKVEKAPEWVLVGDAECIRETERALCVRIPRSYQNDPLMRLKTEIWVPKSQCHPSENEIKKIGDKGFLVIPEWLAKEKGL